MNLIILNFLNSIILTVVILLGYLEPSFSKTVVSNNTVKSNNKSQTIQGQSGGTVDSKGCGFIATSPNHVMNLTKRVDYMRLTVKAAGGQPTLLVVGPNSGDSFCVLGDKISGLKPEISGVWEAGVYEIYIGDRQRQNHQFSLDISTEN